MNITLAGGVILDDSGRVLLMHRCSETRVQWELPGGKVEPGEDPKSACVRELQEELGVAVEPVDLICKVDFTEDGHKMSYNVFLCKIKDGEPTLQEDKFDELRYFSRKELMGCEDLSANMKVLRTKKEIAYVK